MVAYSFNPRFELPILSGAKSGTIRAVGRRRHARAGETLQLYVGQRTRHCRLLGEAFCTSVDPIEITVESWSHGPKITLISVGFGGARLTPLSDLDGFARSDGFESADEMAAFWWKTHRASISCGETLRFSGVLIRWAPFGGPHELD